MRLTNRLTLFFLGLLALVLAGFSTTLYVLTRAYLHGQADERLTAALDTLTAAAEVGPDGVEWEPHQRHFVLGQEDAIDQVRWEVRDDAGHRVDRSRNLAAGVSLAEALPQAAGEARARRVRHLGEPWLVARRRVQGGPQVAANKHAALVMTAGISLAPVQASLRNLAAALGGLSLGVWLLAALAGRAVCGRALVPVARMAVAARAMSAAALDQRLPAPQTGDELEQLGEAFNGLLARLQESFERQRRFTGDASHQLRTPLAAMRGQVEVALRRERSPEEYRHALAVVQKQAGQLHQIVEMLLFLARADAEARLPHVEALDLAGWLDAHVRAWSGHPRSADLRVKCLSAGPVSVEAQAPLLGQLVDNLLDNACKYSEPGTPITLCVQDGRAGVSLRVEDAGCGIPPEDLPHVFEPFYRSPQAWGRGGVGLGLAVAQRIAVALGGTLAVQSEVGRGTVFELRLADRKPPQGPPSSSPSNIPR
jgi:two-component system, OmpR family, sensor kinase